MNTRIRFELGFLLGGICGVIIVSLLLQLATLREAVSVFGSDFEFAFRCPIGEHIFFVLKILGIFIGAALGGLLAVSIRWFAILCTFLLGISIGGVAMLCFEVKAVKRVSAYYEESFKDLIAYSRLQKLKALDQGATNQVILLQFRYDERTMLSNYLCLMEKPDAVAIGSFSRTNSPVYGMIKKYLAKHPNSLPMGTNY